MKNAKFPRGQPATRLKPLIFVLSTRMESNTEIWISWVTTSNDMPFDDRTNAICFQEFVEPLVSLCEDFREFPHFLILSELTDIVRILARSVNAKLFVSNAKCRKTLCLLK